MKTEWTKHLHEEEEKIKFQKRVQSAKEVLDRLKDLVNEYERGLDRSEMSAKSYDTPNWEFKQAHKNGYREALNNIKTLIDLDQQNKQEVK
jgi:hypothetical protein